MSEICLRRLTKEHQRLPKDGLEFLVNWKDTNLRSFEAYIVGPEESVYKCKLIKLRFDFPDDYPFVPPKVKFIQHTGDRLHPNLYTDGKVCLSILGTWQGPGWTGNMTIESVLQTLRSLLDEKPYLHEPNQRDDPGFNAYVRYHGWRWLLLDYLERETDADAKVWLEGYLGKYGRQMVADIERQRENAREGPTPSSPYARAQKRAVDYEGLLEDLKKWIPCVSEPTKDAVPTGQVMEDAKVKRKLPFDVALADGTLAGPPPAKRQHVAIDLESPSAFAAPAPIPKPPPILSPEVIDLTDD